MELRVSIVAPFHLSQAGRKCDMDIPQSRGSGTGISQDMLSACTALCFFPAAMRHREAALCMCSIVKELARRGALCGIDGC